MRWLIKSIFDMYLIQRFRKALVYRVLIRNNLLNPFTTMEPSTPKISLNAYESQLFKDLLHIVNEKKLGTTLRVAGGWVRDKVFSHYSIGNGT